MPAKSPRILLVEDTFALAEVYRAYLEAISSNVQIVETGKEALKAIDKQPPDIVVLDVNLPDMNGIDLMREMKTRGVPAEVVVITGQASVNLAVEAMREGAFDFIMKPLSADRLQITIRNAAERRQLTNQIDEIAEEFHRDRFVNFIGSSLPMQSVYHILQSAAPSNATVFVKGESGTGKELCAEALHKLGNRRNGPMITLNCAAIPKDLLESEIFGHTKGAFSGATSDRKGAALQADGGTLFLDEIGEMDLALQSKLLRFLQEKTVQRVGEDTPRPTDVRIVCATNRDPYAEVAAGRFREDLFYRLHVVPVDLPPLRERGDDALVIAQHYLTLFSKEEHKSFKRFSTESQQLLLDYGWPGNVRQLINAVRNIVVLNDSEVVEVSMFPTDILGTQRAPAPPASPRTAMHPTSVGLETKTDSGTAETTSPTNSEYVRPSSGGRNPQGEQQGISAILPLETVIRNTVESAIATCGGSIPKAAAMLAVSPSTIYRRIQSWQSSDIENGTGRDGIDVGTLNPGDDG